MIQIKHHNINNICHLHYTSVAGDCKGRIEFSIAFFESIAGISSVNSTVNSIKNQYNIDPKTATAFVKKYVKSKKKRNKINQNQVVNILKRTSPSFVSVSGRKNEFKNIVKALRFVENNLHKIINGSPNKLIDMNDLFCQEYDSTYQKGIKDVLEFVLPYQKLIDPGFDCSSSKKWDNYSLTGAINLQACPFCNRSWISTVTEGDTKMNVVNPQLDHFYNQSDFPLLRLSFFNLIPSCELCNSRLKRDKKFDDSYLHPYLEGYDSEAKFKTIALDTQSSYGLGTNYKVVLENSKDVTKMDKVNKIKKNNSLFEINRIYENHGDMISEIYRKSYLSNNKYLSILKSQFPALNRNKNDLYRLALGNYYNKVDFSKRPFAKLTKDIAEQIGLVDV